MTLRWMGEFNILPHIWDMRDKLKDHSTVIGFRIFFSFIIEFLSSLYLVIC